jgi:hypothetical protein
MVMMIRNNNMKGEVKTEWEWASSHVLDMQKKQASATTCPVSPS